MIGTTPKPYPFERGSPLVLHLARSLAAFLPKSDVHNLRKSHKINFVEAFQDEPLDAPSDCYAWYLGNNSKMQSEGRAYLSLINAPPAEIGKRRSHHGPAFFTPLKLGRLLALPNTIIYRFGDSDNSIHKEIQPHRKQYRRIVLQQLTGVPKMAATRFMLNSSLILQSSDPLLINVGAPRGQTLERLTQLEFEKLCWFVPAVKFEQAPKTVLVETKVSEPAFLHSSSAMPDSKDAKQNAKQETKLEAKQDVKLVYSGPNLHRCLEALWLIGNEERSILKTLFWIWCHHWHIVPVGMPDAAKRSSQEIVEYIITNFASNAASRSIMGQYFDMFLKQWAADASAEAKARSEALERLDQMFKLEDSTHKFGADVRAFIQTHYHKKWSGYDCINEGRKRWFAFMCKPVARTKGSTPTPRIDTAIQAVFQRMDVQFRGKKSSHWQSPHKSMYEKELIGFIRGRLFPNEEATLTPTDDVPALESAGIFYCFFLLLKTKQLKQVLQRWWTKATAMTMRRTKNPTR